MRGSRSSIPLLQRALSNNFREGMNVTSRNAAKTSSMLRIAAALVVAVLYVVFAGIRS